MKKIGTAVLCIASIMFAVWSLSLRLSLIEARAEDRHTEIIEQEQQEQEYIGACGNPLDGTTTIRFGVINEIKENSIVFLMDEGDLVEVEVGNPQDFNADRYYCLFYQDDTVFKAWEEHW